MIKQALISVSDKSGIVDFAKSLSDLGVKILSTGGTAKLLADAGLAVTEVADYTGFPEMLDGRVKTLHPKVHGGILARRDLPEHMAALEKHDIPTIDLLVVNLYPFVQTVAKEECSLEDAIENIDIGGPTMLRSAAKNHRDVTVVVDPADYAVVLDEMRANGNAVGYKTNFRLATKVFAHTAQYDGAITNYLTSLTDELQHSSRNTYPATFNLAFDKVQDLRYGENPHQSAAFYRDLVGAGRRAGELRAVAGQGTVVQQHRRFRCGVGMREDLRRAGLRDRQARESVRRGSGRGCARSVCEGVPDRSDLGVRRHHRVQP